MASHRALRTEKFVVGDFSRTLVAGEVYDDLPDDLVATLVGSYGGLEVVESEPEVAEEPAPEVIAPEEVPND